MTIAAKPAVYTVDTGHAHCPDHVWMMDENTGTTLTDRGKTGGYNLTFGATAGAGPDWIADGTHGVVLDFVTANADYAEKDFTAGLSGTHVIGVITKPTAGTAARIAACPCDSSQVDRYTLLTWRADEKLEVSSRFDNTQANSATTGTASGDWDLFLIRFSDTTVDWSLNGSAWATNSVSNTGLVAALNRLTIGARRTTSPGSYYDDPMCAAFWWKADKDPADLYALFSGSSWSFLTTTIKKLKLLVHADAQSDASIAGVVFAAPGGSDITGAKIGEFTGKAFEASLESGKAVLKVPVTDFGGSALDVTDTPVALVRNTTDTTGIITGTVIEE